MRGLSAAHEAYERARLMAQMERDIQGHSGVHGERLGDPCLEGRGERINFNEPARPINCINCGAPRPRISSGRCDYCGSGG